MPRYQLQARVSSENPDAVLTVLQELVGTKGRVGREGAELVVTAELDGTSARELNRTMLSSLRRAEKRTRLRAEWTADGVSERFFDYVPKGRRPA